MDFAARTYLNEPEQVAAEEAILLADGCLLQRPQLRQLWDFVIFVDVNFADVLRRGVARDLSWMGSAAQAQARYHSKYLPGEQRYVDEVRPRERTSVVVDNRDLAAPTLHMPTAR